MKKDLIMPCDNFVRLVTVCWLMIYHSIQTEGHVLDGHAECKQLSKTSINCSGLNLEKIPKFLPGNILLLDLSCNEIRTIASEDLSYLHNLQLLNISNNKIDVIEAEAFVKLTKLRTLDLSVNNISGHSFHGKAFYGLGGLAVLYLHGNRYKNYSTLPIPYVHNLQSLSVDVFEEFHFGSEFLTLTNLSIIELYARDTFIVLNDSFTGLRNSFIPTLNLNFHGYIRRPIAVNYLRPFRHLRNLRVRFGYYCNIKHVLNSLYALSNRTLNELDIGSNYQVSGDTHDLHDQDFIYLATICVRKLDMSHNQITRILSNLLWNSRLSECLEIIRIGDNYFAMKDYFVGFFFANMKNIRYLNFANTKIPFSSFNSYQDILPKHTIKDPSVQRKHPDTNITYHLSPKLETVDFRYVMTYFGEGLREYNHTFILLGVRKLLLGNTKLSFCGQLSKNIHLVGNISSFDASGWICNNLNPTFMHDMGSFSDLITLKFRNSELGEGLKRDKNGLFLKGLKHLADIDLAENFLDTLHENFFQDQLSLQTINLERNNFDHIPPAIASILNLNILNLDNNKFVELSDNDISILEGWHNVSVNFRNNKFICSCDKIRSLRWMKSNQHKLLHLNKIKCRNGLLLLDILENLSYLERHCVSQTWLNISISLFIIMWSIVFGTSMAFRHRYRIMFNYFRYIKYSNGIHYGYRYTAFLAYYFVDGEMTSDAIWAIDHLYPYLRDKLRKTSIIPEKDFDVGEHLVNNIHCYMMKCRKIIIVMSKKFLRSTSSRPYIDMAKWHAFHRKGSSIIVIFIDDTTKEDIPLILGTIWWKINFLRFPHGEECTEERRVFWDQLRAFMEE